MRLIYTALAVFLAAPIVFAQSDQGVFAPMSLPTPNVYRTADGRPGPEYWQQRADYKITATLDSTTGRVTASETISYTNNSPDSLGYLWLFLDQNLFREGSRGSLEFDSPRTRWRGAFANGGDDLTSVVVEQKGKKEQIHYIVDDTRMRIDLASPLAAHGGKLEIQIAWSFVVPPYGSDRTGRFYAKDGTIFEVAQWYPRMCVYDDVNGWNPLPYLGEGEFYLEYGNFDVQITVPHDYIVVGTGLLQNSDRVLTRTERDRLEQARKTDETVHVISENEIGKPEIRPKGTGDLTWKFRAENVRDFSWAASKAFIWDASHWNKILLMAVYPREAVSTDTSRGPGWEKDVEFMRHTFMYYSTHYYPFPYPVATNVAGVVGGMEYPMIVFCSAHARGQFLYSVTDHEFGHGWFPMTVGSDERRHAWMDEGFNTFINYYSNYDYYGDKSINIRRMQPDTIARWMERPVNSQPIETRADMIKPFELGYLEYAKTGLGLRILRENILGPEKFDGGFREYIQRWAFKHPQPSDFFRTIDNYSGEDLSWFWREWFYTTDVFDQSVDSVIADSAMTQIYLSNNKGLVFPTDMQLMFADGKTQDFKLPIEVWYLGNKYTFRLYDDRKVTKVVLDPDHDYPDINRDNDVWTAK